MSDTAQLPDLNVRVILTDETGTINEYPLIDQAGDGVYPLNIAWATTGTFTLAAQAFSGTTQIGTITTNPVRVIPSERLIITVESPLPNTTIYTETEFPAFASNPISFEFAIRLESDMSLFAIQSAFDTPLSSMLTVSLTQAEQTVTALAQPNGQEGQYRAVFSTVMLGDSTVEISLNLPENKEYVSGGAVSLPLTFDHHPQWYLTLTIIIGVVVLLAIIGLIVLLRYMRITRYPLQGKIELSIERDDSTNIVWKKDLKNYNRNRITLNSRQLNLKKRYAGVLDLSMREHPDAQK